MLRHFLWIKIVFGYLLMLSFNLAGETFYVDPGGNDITGDGSQVNPWKSLSYACSQVTTLGDIIKVNDGVYTDNTTCILAPGVNILGNNSNSSNVTIYTSISIYIKASSSSQSSGNNNISGIKFMGNDSNPGGGNWWETGCIFFQFRNNSTVQNCEFWNMPRAIVAKGKSHLWSNCGSPATQSATLCENNKNYSKWPGNADYIAGIDIYNNKFYDAKVSMYVIKDSKIRNNMWDNTDSDASGVNYRSAIGNTAIFWNNVDIYENVIKESTIAWSTIAIEAWFLHDVDIYNNAITGWISMLTNVGIDAPAASENYPSLTIHDNIFNFNGQRGLGSASVGAAIETGFGQSYVKIYNNYISSDGRSSNNGYTKGIGLWGTDAINNFSIYKNVIYNLDGDGDGAIAIKAEHSNSNVNSIYIYHNIIESIETDPGISVEEQNGGVLDHIFVKNNFFTEVYYGARTNSGSPANLYFEYNYEDDGNFALGAGWSANNNYNWSNPGLNKSGNRPTPYYQPSNENANVVDSGIDVGLPFNGSAPDIGAYELGGAVPINLPPTIDAGSNQTVTLPDSAFLNGTVSDDGLPDPPGNVTISWSKTDGPGMVVFSNPNSPNTVATFTMEGTYILQLTADDGELLSTDELTIIVESENTSPSPPQNLRVMN